MRERLHYPVLLNEVLEYLAVDPTGVYVDCTLGAAGYAAKILERLTSGRLIAVDRDREALDAGERKLEGFGDKVNFYHGSYGEIAAAAADAGPLAGVVADLGLSLDQIEDAERGFSFSRPGPLDMRMDVRGDLTAEQILNHYDEREIADLIFHLGGERRSRRIARAIVRGRPIRDTGHLAEIVANAVPRTRGQKIHPATKTFQALRMAVNDELGELGKLLQDAPRLLGPAGRMVVVSFHSGEDRLVKQAFRELARTGEYELLTRRVAEPTEREIDENPASRSAKLRALRKRAN